MSKTYADCLSTRIRCGNATPAEDRLADAAPDLLAALYRLAEAVAEAIACDDPSALGMIAAGGMDDARAAIAKARGS